MSPIDTLPPELLTEIFVYASWIEPTLITLSTLSLVCRLWKNIVQTSPCVWQFISLVDDRGQSIASLRRQATRWITQSSPMPFNLNIVLKIHSQDMILPIFSVVIPELHRWKTCALKIGKKRKAMDVAQIFGESNPGWIFGVEDALVGVVHVEVVVNEPEEEVSSEAEEDEDGDSGDSSSDQKWPSFKRHPAGGIILNLPVNSLPPSDLINPIHVTSLTISEVSLYTPPGTVELLNFLTAFPQLESFVYSGTSLDSAADDSPPPVVLLPRLQHFTVKATCAVRTILSHLDVPMLTSLHLEHLNVDFEFQNPPPAEEGDSDDEANDFSQSPSSDRALGMGLRQLRRRCNPPLHTLIMDYADLRTKDFLYCFENFPLREFRIVASDMSNRVVGMLKPYKDPHGTSSIRLPQLTRLELRNCQQLSGNAVVDALSARVLFVDQAKHLPSMERIAIVDCVNITYEHNLALSQVLGASRFYV